MILNLERTNTSEIDRTLVRLREEGGAVALTRVLTLIVVSEGEDESAIEALVQASGEHPLRAIVLVNEPGDPPADEGDTSPNRLDAEIRVGSDAGAGDIVILRAWGETASDPETLVQALLLPDAPIVAWWPQERMLAPSTSPLGRIAQLRIVDTHLLREGLPVLELLSEHFMDGDANLSWTRLTTWRAQLAAVLDQPPYEPVTSATVEGRRGSTGAILLAAWLHHYLQCPVEIVEAAHGDETPLGDLRRVELARESGVIAMERLSLDTVRLVQPDEPDQLIPLPVRDTTDVLAEELRSLSADEVYRAVLTQGVPSLCVGGVCTIGPRS